MRQHSVMHTHKTTNTVGATTCNNKKQQCLLEKKARQCGCLALTQQIADRDVAHEKVSQKQR